MAHKCSAKEFWICIFMVFGYPLMSSCMFIPYSPCTTVTLEPCKNHPLLLSSVVCENIDDMSTFIRVIRCGAKKNMQEMFLENSSIDYLPLYILDFCGFVFLNVKSVVLSKLLEGNVMIRLQQLHLDDVRISSPWNWEPIGVLKRLLRFSVANMVIQVVDKRLVAHLSEKLQSFMLTSTNTSLISDNAFVKFSDMIYISIVNNNINELKRTMFPRPAKIKYLYFGKNKISSLPQNLFHDMPDLEVIGLQGNLISEINEVTFRGIWNQMSFLLLEDNPLKCYCKMLWLAKERRPAIFTGECFAPKATYGKPVKSLNIFDFDC